MKYNIETLGVTMSLLSYLDTAARTPAAHIIQVWDPNPYHMSCSISNTSPTMMVCFEPTVFINKVSRPV